MNILAIMFVHNEVKYLPHVLRYYQMNGLDTYVIDNESHDGTWEWLQDNHISSRKFSTDGAFDLRLLQGEATKVIYQRKADWALYGSADQYHVYNMPIRDAIENIDHAGFNQVRMRCYGAINTGEEFGTPLPWYFFQWAYWKEIVMCSKILQGFTMFGDNISVDEPKIFNAPGLIVNYGACKPADEQEHKLERRQKAWANGMRAGQGKHFLKGKALNWVYPKDYQGAVDIRTIEDRKYLSRLLYDAEIV